MEKEMSESAVEILVKYLQDLRTQQLSAFTLHLNIYSEKKQYSRIPKAGLENASYLQIAQQMISHYNDERALEIAKYSLSKIPRMDLLEKFQRDLQKYLNINRKLWETRDRDHKKNYMRYISEKFRIVQDNSRLGEYISLKKIYTKLLIVKEHRPQAEREDEIMSSGRKHLEIMAQRAGHSYSSVAALFDPDEDGHVPRTIVLQGAAGFGKTMMARKIMLDWASGELFQGRFDYVFYINCREINRVPGQQTMVEHLLHRYPWMSPLMSELSDPDKLLFIIDGFDEMTTSIGPTAGDPCRGTQWHNNIMSVIGKQFIFQPYVIITTRPTALHRLRKCVVTQRFAEILGFSEDDRKEYFTRFFKDQSKGVQALNILKENDLFTMCFVPVLCWIICTVIKLQMEKKEDPVYALRMTSVYMSFLSNFLKQQSSDSVQPIHMNLQRLCALAKEGVWQQKILFEEQDINKYGLAIPAIQSLFLNNYIFLKATECKNCYSFIHLSFQEFFAAMFYVLREDEETAEHTENPRRAVIRLLEASRTQKHLMLTVRFLFGLLNEETLNQMETRFQWKISSDIKPALRNWIKQEMKDLIKINNKGLELFHCLYESQDEEFVKSATEHLKDIWVYSASLNRDMNDMDVRALGFCLKNVSAVERVTVSDIMKPEDLRALMPGLMKCLSLKMIDCSLTASCCADLSSVLTTNSSLTELHLSRTKLRDSGVRELSAAMKYPGCKIQRLVMTDCSLTASCCADLSSVLRNRSLRELDLSYNELRDSGVRALSEGLSYGCSIQTLLMINCSLTGSCCAALSSVLRRSTSLTELYLSSNTLCDYGVRELCEGLTDLSCPVQTLGLRRTGLTDSSCSALCSTLWTNRTLQRLYLSENHFTWRSAPYFSEFQETHIILGLMYQRTKDSFSYYTSMDEEGYFYN